MSRHFILACATMAIALASAAQGAIPASSAGGNSTRLWGGRPSTHQATETTVLCKARDAGSPEGILRGAVLLDGDGTTSLRSSDVFNIRNAVSLAAWVWADPIRYPDWSASSCGGGPNRHVRPLLTTGQQAARFQDTAAPTEWTAAPPTAPPPSSIESGPRRRPPTTDRQRPSTWTPL